MIVQPQIIHNDYSLSAEYLREKDVENKTHIYYACIGFRASGI